MFQLNDELMSLMVHDLKNPLAALMANLGYVASAVRQDPEAREAVADCLLSTEAIGRLLENLYLVTRSDGGAREGRGECAVDGALAAVAARIGRHAAAAGVTVEVGCGSDCGAVPLARPAFELALDNLVSAALASSPSGATVRVEARVEDGQVVVAVSDQAGAFSDELKPLVGELEGQLVLKGAEGGRYARGFGLHVAAQLARSAGGSLEALDAEADRGCALVLRLPRVA